MFSSAFTIDNHIIYITFTSLFFLNDTVNHSLKCCRGIFHSKWGNCLLVKPNGSNKGSSHSQRDLPITLKKIKFTDICCPTNFVNTIFYLRYWKRIGLCHIIDFSVICTKSKCSIWFWHQNTGGTKAAIAGFYYNIYCISFWRCSTLYGLNLYGCCLIGVASPTSTS